MQTRASLSLALLPLLGGLVSDQANASTLLLFDGNVAISSRSDGGGSGLYTIGNSFTVGATAIVVTHLGVQDVDNATRNAGTNGFASSVEVGLWSSSGGTPLATATVAGTETLGAGGYRYVALGQGITLQANTTYLIGARVGSGEEYFLDDYHATNGTTAYTAASAAITLNSSNFISSGALAAPTTVGGNGINTGRWGAANLQFDLVPEPSVALLGGLGMFALLRRRR